MIFRFDDICLNTDMANADAIAGYFHGQGYDVQYAVSVVCQRTNNEFVFDPILKAYSDHRLFYDVDTIGMPDVPDYVKIVSHGIVHVDHRLLVPEAQEMSIRLSCALLNTKIFAPPFNKWNAATEEICKRNEIKLQKFEDGWRGVEHNKFSRAVDKWYLHSRNLTLEKTKHWLDCDNHDIGYGKKI